MYKWPKVAIIILNWNGWKDTIECLESVFRNNYPNYKVIVVDNSSTDGSIEKIKDWADGRQEVLTPDPTHSLYHLSHPPVLKPIPYIEYNRKKAETGGNPKLESSLVHSFFIKYPLILIQSNDNLGFSAGNNIGIRYVLEKGDCDYIWLLNNDTIIDKNALIEMVKLARADKKIGIVGSKLFYYNKVNAIQSIGEICIGLWRFKKLLYIYKNKKNWNENIKVMWITGASLLVKKDILNIIGLLDEKYFLQSEEVDFCKRASDKGFKTFYCYKSEVWHKVGISKKDKLIKKNNLCQNNFCISWEGAFVNYYSIRNSIYFTRKNFPNYFILYCLLLPYKILRLVFTIILYNNDHKFDRIGLVFKAIFDGLSGKMGKTIDPLKWRRNV